MDMNKAEKDYTLKVLTVSGGISSYPYAAGSMKELVDNADMAVYQVKRRGKNAIMLAQFPVAAPIQTISWFPH